MGLKVRRQKTRMALRHEKRVLQKSEIALGREGVSQAINFPEVRNEIVALKKLEQEQKEVAVRIAQIEEGVQANRSAAAAKRHRAERSAGHARGRKEAGPRSGAIEAKSAADVCDRELAGVERLLAGERRRGSRTLEKLPRCRRRCRRRTISTRKRPGSARAACICRNNGPRSRAPASAARTRAAPRRKTGAISDAQLADAIDKKIARDSRRL